MVRVSSPAKLRPWSELTDKIVMGVVPGLVNLRNVYFMLVLKGIFGGFLKITCKIKITCKVK